MVLPKRTFETGDDDIQIIDSDIDSLKDKFLDPIDAIRSFAQPGSATTGAGDGALKDMKQDNIRPMESRTHAFYRFIGLPVATADGFYNPGFNPTGTQFLGELTGVSKKRKTINKQVADSQFKRISDIRELDHSDVRFIFARQNLNSSLYALMLSQDIRPFQVLDEGAGPFDADEQRFSVDARTETVDSFFRLNENLAKSEVALLNEFFGVSFADSRHLLRPFIVDPRIDISVMPNTSRMAVPFLLDEGALKIEESKAVLRPGIEAIIRERLRKSTEVDDIFFEAVEKIASGDIGPSDLLIAGSSVIDTQAIINTVEAILGETEISDVVLADLEGTSTVQVRMINELVKTLKSILKVMVDSIEDIDKARQEINWVPVPNPEGPEINRGSSLSGDRIAKAKTPIDKRILSLSLQKLTADRQITEQEGNRKLGNFASPFKINTNNIDVKTITSELDAVTEHRDCIANAAFLAMTRIELISGEVSGLGLLDVICIYIALWAMDEKSLISMLDEESFTRLVQNEPQLIVGAAANRRDSGAVDDISTALGNFEEKVINVLKFADREFARQALAPGEEEGGNVSPDS